MGNLTCCIQKYLLSADSDEEALKILKAINPKTLNWQEADVVEQRMTYEIVNEDS